MWLRQYNKNLLPVQILEPLLGPVKLLKMGLTYGGAIWKAGFWAALVAKKE